MGGLIEQAAKQAERVAADLAAATARELAKAAAPVVKAAAPVVKAAVPGVKSAAAAQVGSSWVIDRLKQRPAWPLGAALVGGRPALMVQPLTCRVLPTVLLVR